MANTNKQHKGFLEGIASAASILIYLLLVFGMVSWIIKAPIKEKVVFIIVLLVGYLSTLIFHI
jgi:hypothetical protein